MEFAVQTTRWGADLAWTSTCATSLHWVCCLRSDCIQPVSWHGDWEACRTRATARTARTSIDIWSAQPNSTIHVLAVSTGMP